MKPTGKKNYGSIPHLLESKKGKTDKYITEGQHNICTFKTRDKHDKVIVQEKYDGSNVGIARVDGKIFALTRSGYEAHTSPYYQHHVFDKWVDKNKNLFKKILSSGERITGEWLYQSHGLKYIVDGNPFVAFDLFNPENERFLFEEFDSILSPYKDIFHTPKTVWNGNASCGVGMAFGLLKQEHPVRCLGKPEGAVWRVERKGKVDFLAKFVRPDFEPGLYVPGLGVNPSDMEVTLNVFGLDL